MLPTTDASKNMLLELVMNALPPVLTVNVPAAVPLAALVARRVPTVPISPVPLLRFMNGAVIDPLPDLVMVPVPSARILTVAVAPLRVIAAPMSIPALLAAAPANVSVIAEIVPRTKILPADVIFKASVAFELLSVTGPVLETKPSTKMVPLPAVTVKLVVETDIGVSKAPMSPLAVASVTFVAVRVPAGLVIVPVTAVLLEVFKLIVVLVPVPLMSSPTTMLPVPLADMSTLFPEITPDVVMVPVDVNLNILPVAEPAIESLTVTAPWLAIVTLPRVLAARAPVVVAIAAVLPMLPVLLVSETLDAERTAPPEVAM